jgi:predicted small metal-binding protein
METMDPMSDTAVRKSVDCRNIEGSNCSVKISADTEDEVLEAAVQHAVIQHGDKDTPELRRQLQTSIGTDYE